MPDASQLTISTTGLIIFIFFNIICNKTKLTSKLLMAFVEAERLHELKKLKVKIQLNIAFLLFCKIDLSK
jgi:hypothetical protein